MVHWASTKISEMHFGTPDTVFIVYETEQELQTYSLVVSVAYAVQLEIIWVNELRHRG